MKPGLLLWIFLAVLTSSANAAIAIRQSASAKAPDESCVTPSQSSTETCTPSAPAILTVNFGATIPGTVPRAFVYNGVAGESCSDNLGQAWTQSSWGFAPPSPGRSDGISSLTCSAGSLTQIHFFEIVGANPAAYVYLNQISLIPLNTQFSCGSVSPNGLGIFFVSGNAGWDVQSSNGTDLGIPAETAAASNLSPGPNTGVLLSRYGAPDRNGGGGWYDIQENVYFLISLAAIGGDQGLNSSITLTNASANTPLPSGSNILSATENFPARCDFVEFAEDYRDEGADLGCDCENEAQVGLPINVKNGNTYIQESDFSVPGLNRGLQLSRAWNSLWAIVEPTSTQGLFGHSWRSNVEERLVLNDSADGTAAYWRGDGSIWRFSFDSTTASYRLTMPSNGHARFQVDTNSNHAVMTLTDGTKKLFSLVAGQLVAEVDRNGNATAYTYGSGNRLAMVTDPAGRRLYFSYGDSRFPFQVTNVNSDAGISSYYTYDSSGRLTQVQHADGSTTNFQYDTNSLMLSVTDSQGKVLESHTYDSQRRGLSSSRANGVDALTVSYPN